VTVGPATPVQPPSTQAIVAPPAKAKAAKPRTQAQKKQKPPKKNGGNDPLFMYD